MKKKIKKMLIFAMLITMLFSNGIVANAAEPETRAEHVCAFSYVGFHEIYRNHVSTHNYLYYNAETQAHETRTCRIYYVIYERVYQCACGKTNKETYNVTEHSEYHE